MLDRVRERKMGSLGSALVKELAGAAVKEQDGRSALSGRDFHVLPREAAAPSGSERLERCLLGGEARGVMLSGESAAPLAVGALGGRVDALEEARRAPADFAYAINFDNVYAYGNNHGR